MSRKESMPMGDPSANKQQEEAEWAEMRRKAEEAFKKEKALPSMQVDASLEPIEIDLSKLEEVKPSERSKKERAKKMTAIMKEAEAAVAEEKKVESRKKGEASFKKQKELGSMVVDASLGATELRLPASPKEKDFTPSEMKSVAPEADKETSDSAIGEAFAQQNEDEFFAKGDRESAQNAATQKMLNEESMTDLRPIRPYERPMSERKIFKKEEEQLAEEGKIFVARREAKEKDAISMQAAVQEVAAAGGMVGEFVNKELAKQEQVLNDKFGIDNAMLDRIAGDTLGYWDSMKLKAKKLVNKDLRDALDKYTKERTSAGDAVQRYAEEAQGPEYYAAKLNRDLMRRPSAPTKDRGPSGSR